MAGYYQEVENDRAKDRIKVVSAMCRLLVPVLVRGGEVMRRFIALGTATRVNGDEVQGAIEQNADDPGPLWDLFDAIDDLRAAFELTEVEIGATFEEVHQLWHDISGITERFRQLGTGYDEEDAAGDEVSTWW